ncbi:MAG: hypothetical protein J6Q82_06035 [Clostridia bacterium]|nr:hypothetical protein [Clostridia bacterium]
MNKQKRLLLSALITAVIAGLGYYVVLPPINIYAQAFWGSLAFVVLVFGAAYVLIGSKAAVKTFFSGKGDKGFADKTAEKKKKTRERIVFFVCLGIPVVVLIVGNLLSSTFFNATAYSTIIEVPEAVFEEDMPENDIVTNIPLMDSASANIIGNRKLGELSAVVSQYQVNGTYSQINYGGIPRKVSSLEYVDFFKWLNNRDAGVPGYVSVDPVNSSADYVEFETPIKYTDSAYFEEDLNRTLRFSYPTKIFGTTMFELDEEGNPYYIVSCLSPKVGLFGGMDVSEVIIFNPCDKTSELYSVSDTPSWVDNVFSGSLASQKYDWYGTLQNGYWNSVIGNKDCKVTTDDYGYIVLGDDVWFFTGVTSVVSDESNIGFIISNARTGEYKFYPVVGAEEYSAMGAAQGHVQEKGYTASFPSLINVSGEATYIMVLKDANGIVKMVALVNVENYTIVATGSNQQEAKQAYLEELRREGILGDDEEESPSEEEAPKPTEISFVVKEIRFLTTAGETFIYLTGDDGNIYKKQVSEDESVLFIKGNDLIEGTYLETENKGIYQLVTWERYLAPGQGE